MINYYSYIYIRLLDEGTEVYRPVKAMKVSKNIYKINSKPSDDEVWEFLYGDHLICKDKKCSDDLLFCAVEKIKIDY